MSLTVEDISTRPTEQNLKFDPRLTELLRALPKITTNSMCNEALLNELLLHRAELSHELSLAERSNAIVDLLNERILCLKQEILLRMR